MSQEVTILLQKILDKLSEMSMNTYTDHVFKEVDVPTSGVVIDVDAYVVKLSASISDIIVNLDRPITQDEYITIYRDTYKVLSRKVSKIYAQALNTTGKLKIIGLK